MLVFHEVLLKNSFREVTEFSSLKLLSSSVSDKSF